MRFLLVLLFLLATYITGYSQDTPYIKPVTYTPQTAAGYQFKQVKIDTSALIKKLLVKDTASFTGKIFVSTPATDDSSYRAANTKWIKENISPGVPGLPTYAWSTTGNYSAGIGDNQQQRLGYLDSTDLRIMTNHIVRMIIRADGIKRNSGAANKYLAIDTITKTVYYTDGGSGSGGSGVTSITFGYGLNGGTVTTTGTGSVDTATIATLGRLLSDSTILKALIDANEAQITANTAAITQRTTYTNVRDSLDIIRAKQKADSTFLAAGINGKLATADLPAKLADSLQNYVNAVNNISPLLNFSISNRTLIPTLQNAAANTVFGNHTGSTGAPSYGKLPVASISATGTPGSGNFLRGDGSWQAGAFTQWLDNINGIHYASGNVGFGMNLPTSKIHLQTNSIGAAVTESAGIFLSNTTAATSTVQQWSPPLVFEAQGWKTNATAASQSVKFRLAATTQSSSVNPSGYLDIFSSVNGAADVSVVSFTAGGGVSTSGQIQAGNRITGREFVSTVTNSVGFGFSATHNNLGTGVDANYFTATPTLNSPTGSSTVRGFYFNPTNTNVSGFAAVNAFQNTSGNSLFGTTSGSVGIGANTSINSSAILDITSTSKGLLTPRQTTAQRIAIASPATGLLVYDTDLKSFYYYENSVWNPVSGSYATNATTTGLSSATLNSTYPNVPVGYRVICGAIMLGGAIYTKYSEAGSSDVWLMTSAPVQP